LQERGSFRFPVFGFPDENARMAVFEQLRLWIDPVRRPGPEAMAVDEWLLEIATVPVLRVYGWLGNWGSLGYFGKLPAACAAFPQLGWVRRWTGGGTVDHRSDWTYTLVAPTGSKLDGLRGAESYRILHAALASVLEAEHIGARLSSGADQTGAALCFENPVSHDLIDFSGRKLAGAGQRRTRCGLLHQGSVAAPCEESGSKNRAERLSGVLAENWQAGDFQPPSDLIDLKIRSRYGCPAWTRRC
jgi:lipoate-protein ligase A